MFTKPTVPENLLWITYVEHLGNIGRKYFSRPDDAAPGTEMTNFEKQVLAGYLLLSDYTNPDSKYMKSKTKDNINELTRLTASAMLSGEVEEERALLTYIKDQVINFYKIDMEHYLRHQAKEVDNARTE